MYARYRHDVLFFQNRGARSTGVKSANRQILRLPLHIKCHWHYKRGLLLTGIEFVACWSKPLLCSTDASEFCSFSNVARLTHLSFAIIHFRNLLESSFHPVAWKRTLLYRWKHQGIYLNVAYYDSWAVHSRHPNINSFTFSRGGELAIEMPLRAISNFFLDNR